MMAFVVLTGHEILNEHYFRRSLCRSRLVICGILGYSLPTGQAPEARVELK